MSSSSSGARLLGDRSSGEVGVHVLGAESGRRPEPAETVQATGLVPDLLLQFPLRGLVRVFAGIDPACRSLKQVFAYRVPVLSNEQCPARLIDGQNDHSVGVLGHLACSPLAIGELDLVHVQLDHPPVEHVTAPNRAFRLYFPVHGVIARHARCDD